MPISRVLHETKHAYLRCDPDGDEFAIDQKPPGAGGRDDPIALGFGAWRHGDGEQYICKIRFDLLSESNGHRRQELGFLAVKLDTTGRLFFEVYRDDQLALTLRPEHLARLLAILNGAGGGMATADRLATGNGQYVYNVQPDPTEEFPFGRIVQYATHGSADETTWTPVAILRPEPLP